MNPAPALHTDFDPVTLEILWSRLISIADESAAALVRTSFSTIVRECNDYATVLMDANGDALAENTAGIPSFVGILPLTLKHFLAKYPKDKLRPGDCLITNDPWMATGHLPDITMAAPIFHGDRLVGFSGSVAHSPDIGGSLWSSDCRELFEEGLRIPPVKFLVEGEPNTDVFEFILGNVRIPDQVLGDLNAQVTANRVCGRRLVEFLEDAEMVDLAALSEALQSRAEAAMRKAIEAVPDGTYRASVDADGFDEDETHIECTITVDGSRLHVDYAGTSRQIERGLNSVMNYTQAYTVYPIKCALDPLTPRNEGSYRSITVDAPEGSILNPRYPAPCNARQLTGHLLAGAIYGALAEVVPDKIIAGKRWRADAQVRLQRHRPPRQPVLADPLRQWRHGGERRAGRAPHHGLSHQRRCRQHRGVREHLAAHRLAEGVPRRFRRTGPTAGRTGTGDRGRGHVAGAVAPVAALGPADVCRQGPVRRWRGGPGSDPIRRRAASRTRNRGRASVPASACCSTTPVAPATARPANGMRRRSPMI